MLENRKGREKLQETGFSLPGTGSAESTKNQAAQNKGIATFLMNVMTKRGSIESDKKSQSESKSGDKEKCPYKLIPLGVALHHMNDSQILVNLYQGIRSECLKEIDHMI